MASTRPAPVASSGRTGVVYSPARYAPMAHPGHPGRWDRDSILQALRAWVAQTRSVPRRNDWCGRRSVETTAAQRKWMREHPAWPSSSCVAAHFGSWSAALEAADLPARRLTFESSVAERVRTARRLAASGVGVQAIARELEVSRSSVHNYLRARDCPACGGPVTNPHVERCATCAAHQPTVARACARASVQEAIRDWLAEHGRSPAYREWTPSRGRPGRWEAESPRWPSASIVCALYGDHADPWNSALLNAGAKVRFRRWSDASIRAALATFWVQTGRPPRRADLAGAAWQGPHPATLPRRYGSLIDAWRLLGPAPAQADP